MKPSIISWAVFLVAAMLGSGTMLGQTPAPANPLLTLPKDRLTAAIDNSVSVALPGNIRPEARPGDDAGPVPDDMPMPRMILTLKRDADQQAALDAFSAALQDPRSSFFHQWLTSRTFGEHFGLSQSDLDRLADWLKSLGFTVDEIPPGHWTITFSGTASQVENAFHTPIHYYRAGGELRYANASDPQIPQSLALVVAGIAGLHNFRPRHAPISAGPHAVTNSGQHFLDPSDFATIYNLNPLYNAGIKGNGVRIAVIEPCSMNVSLAQTFWALEGVLQNSNSGWGYGTPAPCSTTGNEMDEVFLDYEWAGAVAPQAQLWLVSSNASDTLLGAVQGVVEYGVSNAAGVLPPPVATAFVPVITMSYLDCESQYDQANWVPLWQQAHMQGITGLVSSGDTGAAACDGGDSPTTTVATHGRTLNGYCASPYVICVGGNEFNDTSDPAEYWSAAGHAMGYIPEVAWNESGTLSPPLWGASGGGYSTLQTRPAWQTGNTNTQRGEPDVALSAASHDGYRICDSSNPCASNSVWAVGGTSAATPSFAGIMALVVQAAGNQGSPNQTLYNLAAQPALEAFHDIVTGNNSVNGVVGFNAGPGWDPVTGLGSVDATALVANWPGASTGIPAPTSLGVSKVAPSTTVCAPPPPSTSFLTTDGTVYLYFGATVTTSDKIGSDWLAPNGDVLPGFTYNNTGAGPYCFTMAQLSVAGQSTAHLGLWQARIYNNGSQIESISFTLGQGAGPVISSLSQTTVTANSGSFPLTVTGSGFASGATILVNGTALSTMLVSSTQLTTTVPGNLISSAGSLFITVSSGGLTSNAQTITITAVVSSNLPRIGVLAQVAAGAGWDTEVYLTNATSGALSVALSFFSDNGTALTLPLVATQQGASVNMLTSMLTAVIPANTTLAVDTGTMSANVEGWADVHSNGPLTGFAVFRYAPQGLTSGPGVTTPWEGTVPLQTLLTASTVIVPFDNTGGFATGIALGNLNTSGLNLTATFFNDSGSPLGSAQTIALSGDGHTSFVLNSMFGFTANLKGLMKISGSGVMALGLRASPYGTLTSVPVPVQ